MYTNRCMDWVRRACAPLRYPPDRAETERELYEHIMCRYQTFLDSGMSEQEADEAAAEAMGDPAEVGRELAAVHRPFLGFLLLFLRVIGICAAAFAVVLLIRQYRLGAFGVGNPYSTETAILDASRLRQGASVKCGSYRFTVDRAAEDADGNLLIRLKYRTPNPLLGPPRMWGRDITLTDSLQDRRECHCFYSRGGAFFGELYFSAAAESEKTDWVVFRYDNGVLGFELPILLGEVKS